MVVPIRHDSRKLLEYMLVVVVTQVINTYQQQMHSISHPEISPALVRPVEPVGWLLLAHHDSSEDLRTGV